MPITRFDPQKHRRSIRLKDYDYSSNGAYFVTMVTWRRDMLFGEIIDGNMRLNDFGAIADECWRDVPEHFPNVDLGAYVIMPNHVHGVVVINDMGDRRGTIYRAGATQPDKGKGAAMLRPNVKPGSLGAIIRSYKSAVSYRIHKELNATGIWQRNYYEHIIRDEKDLQRITDYIEMNPLRWNDDDENPARTTR